MEPTQIKFLEPKACNDMQLKDARLASLAE